jgi:small subunit ribosomal protein S15
VSKRAPAWCKYKPEEVEAMIIKLAKEGHPPSKIGTILRDQHGIPLSKALTGKTITRILTGAKLASSLPEDFENMVKMATRLRGHLEKNAKDLHNKRALQIVEAKIHKLTKYYKRKGVLPPDWKYEPKAASLI